MHCLQASQVYDVSIQAYQTSQIGGANTILGETLRRFLAFLYPAAKVLDLGCGPGIHAKTVLESHPLRRVAGIDLSAAMVSCAKAHARGAVFRRGDFRTMRFPENAYDAALLASVAFHLNQADLANVLGMLRTTLKPDGLLFLNVWSGANSGFKHLDFALRPMMVFYHERPSITRLLNEHDFGILGAESHERWLHTSAGGEAIREHYFFGHLLKDIRASDRLN